MKTTHVGLIKIQRNMIVAVRYMESKWERQLGDRINYDGMEYKVAVIGECREDVIHTLNDFIRTQNSVVRKRNNAIKRKQKIEEAKIWRELLKDMDIVKEGMMTLDEAVNLVNSL